MLKKAVKYTILLMLLTACTSLELEKSYTFPDNTWKRFESPVINMEISQPGIFYDLFIEVKYDINIARKTMPVSVITYTPNGETRSRTLTVDFNEGNGTLRLLLRKDFAFSEAGNCSFEFENRSQDLETIGIQKIGVILEKIE